MDYPSTVTVCNIIVGILAFLPFVLSICENKPSAAEQEQEPLPQQQEQEPVQQQEPEVVYRPILSYVVSDIEVAMIETLCEANAEMSSREVLNNIVAFYPELGRKAVNRSLYRLHDQSIISMRRDGNTPLWSISA